MSDQAIDYLTVIIYFKEYKYCLYVVEGEVEDKNVRK